jgi:heparan-alpha-glucosaminide N-acetyltransferase
MSADIPPSDPTRRLASVDAYRGLVMLLMFAEVLRSCEVSAALSTSRFWQFICHEQTHAAWTGCSLHDLIQPGFYFLVGVGLIFSLRRRLASGHSSWALTIHVLRRALVLIVLGMALVAVHPRQWSWWFDDTLTQIGLAYPFVFLVARRRRRNWWIGLALILIGYWLVFALYPLPPAGFDYAEVHVSSEWLGAHALKGFEAHWQKNSNAAWAFDHWLLNQFPRAAVYTGEETGLTTLNFVPSIGTMILGLLAGDVLRSPREPRDKLRWLVIAGLALMSSGYALDAAGIVPIVKAIWTPSWVLFSGGWCCLFLAAFYLIVDIRGYRRVAFPLTVIGLNSIVAYSLSHLFPAFAFNSLHRVLGSRVFQLAGASYEPAVYGAAVLILYWVVLYLLYRRRIFLRI